MKIKDQMKKKLHYFWNKKSCGTEFTTKKKFTKKYFEEIEKHRYYVEPEIFSFAQFTRYYGKKILEVGIGAGTDFTQWVKAGAEAYGIDLTKNAIEHVKKRMEIYKLRAKGVKVADCENIPYKDNSFDLVYSWGVIHHTPNTKKALTEIIRVTKPSGECKIMVYHRHSLLVFMLWVKYALLKARPWKSFSWCLYHYVESLGTKAFTRKEVEKMLHRQPVQNIEIKTILTVYDTLAQSNIFSHSLVKILAYLLGNNRVGWFMTIKFNKKRK